MNRAAIPGTRPPRNLVVIGSSTGGTRVLNELFKQLPCLPASVVIVQHMRKFINVSLVRTLSQYTPMAVQLARAGDQLTEGGVFIAPSELHCTLVSNSTVHLEPDPKVNNVCPSIDVTMQSTNPPCDGQRLMGVLLTGMGKDGAAGLAPMKQVGR